MSIITLLLSAILAVENINNADLIFVVERTDTPEDGMSGAIIGATASGRSCATHVGLIARQGDSLFVIDAAPRTGVSIRPLEKFASECVSSESTSLVIMRMTCPFDADAVISKARSLTGKKYDFTFLPGNDSWYCSEFVQECFTDSSGVSVFESHPMTFKDADGNIPEYWQQLFAKLGMSVPEGVPGTNPDDMMRDVRLTRISTSFKLRDFFTEEDQINF